MSTENYESRIGDRFQSKSCRQSHIHRCWTTRIILRTVRWSEPGILLTSLKRHKATLIWNWEDSYPYIKHPLFVQRTQLNGPDGQVRVSSNPDGEAYVHYINHSLVQTMLFKDRRHIAWILVSEVFNKRPAKVIGTVLLTFMCNV